MLPGVAHAAASTPPARTITRDGALGRFLLDGTWRFHADPHRRGNGAAYSLGRGGGWRPVTVPNAWNAHDLSPKSMGGGNVWYRKDFRLPHVGASGWLVRFESVRYRARVWLNGRFIGEHEGAYLPWELHLVGLRRGVNHLAVQVNNKQHSSDLPPGKLSLVGSPSGGWWNWGGILRDVYLRRVQGGIDIAQAQVLPRLTCRTCAAGIDYRVTVRNYGGRARSVRVTTSYGPARASLGTVRVPGGGTKVARGRLRLAKPHLWSPDDPYLYPVAISAGPARWSLHSGVRSIAVQGGRLMLNFRPTHFRGVFLHEDDPNNGGAITTARTDLFLRLAKQDLGATVLRTHYPLNPYLHEQADRLGLLIWSEIPVFQISSKVLAKPKVRAKALGMLRANILANGNHPSVMSWSLGNELNSAPSSSETTYFKRGARLAHGLDPTRPVALAIQGYTDAGCLARAYKPIQLLGLNAYFGWYPGPQGSIADRTRLGSYLDFARACYPTKALAVTEFGAEGNRHGPPEDRGTYEFQSNLNGYENGVFAQKDWLSGAIGMLIEFRVRPNWSGGNPLPSTQPLHQKGVFDFFGNPKPAADVLSRWFHSTQQYDLPLP